MELLVHERMNLLSILPKEGNFTTLRIVRELREALSFSEEEYAELNIRIEGEGEASMVRWDMPEDLSKLVKEIPIGRKARDIAAKVLEDMNEKEKLTEPFFSLYEKFCVTEGED